MADTFFIAALDMVVGSLCPHWAHAIYRALVGELLRAQPPPVPQQTYGQQPYSEPWGPPVSYGGGPYTIDAPQGGVSSVWALLGAVAIVNLLLLNWWCWTRCLCGHRVHAGGGWRPQSPRHADGDKAGSAAASNRRHSPPRLPPGPTGERLPGGAEWDMLQSLDFDAAAPPASPADMVPRPWAALDRFLQLGGPEAVGVAARQLGASEADIRRWWVALQEARAGPLGCTARARAHPA